MIQERQFGQARGWGNVAHLGWRLVVWSCGLLLPLLVPLFGVQAGMLDGGIDPLHLGKGDWIYALTDATNRLGGHVAVVTNETSLLQFYRAQGFRFIVVKAATSDQLFKGCYNAPQFTRALVDAAHTNGLWILAYNRSYGSNILGEVAVADYVFSQGADGYVWDAEAEWESSSPWINSSGPAKAWALCSAVRSNWPSKFLAYAPFPIISYHPTFPYKEFGYWCDAVMPQIYHSGWTGVLARASGGINWSDSNWSAWQNSLINSNSSVNGTSVAWTNAIKPLIPLTEVYGPAGISRCATGAPAINDREILEFLDYLVADPNCPNDTGYGGVSFWRADLHGLGQWAHLRDSSIGEKNPTSYVLDDSAAVVVGSWTVVTTFADGLFFGSGLGTDTNSFGTNYLVRPHGKGDAFVEFRPKVDLAAQYAVYQWHPFRIDASAAVPFWIGADGETNIVYANQQTNAGNWSLLGQFHFTPGANCFIRVCDAVPETNAVALVDAVKLVRLGRGTPH